MPPQSDPRYVKFRASVELEFTLPFDAPWDGPVVAEAEEYIRGQVIGLDTTVVDCFAWVVPSG